MLMGQMVKQERLSLLRTSLLKTLFPGGGGASGLLAVFRTFLIFGKNQKAEQLLNMIFENTLPKGYFRSNKMNFEISLLSSDS